MARPYKGRAFRVMKYSDPEENRIVQVFRTIDSRKGRMPGLLSLKALIDDYHTGEMARRWHAATDALIAEERASEARRRRRRERYASKRASAVAAR